MVSIGEYYKEIILSVAFIWQGYTTALITGLVGALLFICIAFTFAVDVRFFVWCFYQMLPSKQAANYMQSAFKWDGNTLKLAKMDA